MKLTISIACLSAVAQGAVVARDTLKISVPKTKPDGSVVVPKDFIGFGMESAFLNNFDNEFSANLVSSLANRMSKPPVIRIGGTSGDYFIYDPNQETARICVEGSCPTGNDATYKIGPSYFDGYKRFTDAKMIIQAPVQKPVNLTNSLAYVWHAWNNLGQGDRVAAIALGNEPEFIHSALQGYVNASLEIEQAIVKNLSLSGDAANIFEAGNTASSTITDGTYYNVIDILNSTLNNGRISATAEHWYQISNTNSLWTDAQMQAAMINHTAITSRFDLYVPSIKASQERNIPYAITEDAAVLGGAPTTFSGGFGYCLWAVDFNMAAMSRGVARVANLAGRPVERRVFWVPDDSAGDANPGPQVRAPYPAAIFIADFLGKTASAVTELSTNNDLLSAYAMYDETSNALQRVAIVNMSLYNGTSGGEREQTTFQVSVGSATKVTVKRLHADKGVAALGYDYGGSTNNVTWAGEQWSHSIDMGKGHYASGAVEEETVTAKNGIVSVVIPASEAVILFV